MGKGGDGWILRGGADVGDGDMGNGVGGDGVVVTGLNDVDE